MPVLSSRSSEGCLHDAYLTGADHRLLCACTTSRTPIVDYMDKREDHEKFSELCVDFVAKGSLYHVKLWVSSTPQVVTYNVDGGVKVGLFIVSRDGQLHDLDFTNKTVKEHLTALAEGRENTALLLGRLMLLKFAWIQDQTREVDETSDLSLPQRCVRLVNREIENSKINNFKEELGADKRHSIVLKGYGVALTSLRLDGGGWTCIRLDNPQFELFLEQLAEIGLGCESCWVGPDAGCWELVHAHFQFVLFSVFTLEV